MIKVGLTGGIGAGKSYVANVFSKIGIPVYDADSSAKKLMNSNEYLISDIKNLLGEQSYVDGVLDRRYVAEKVFVNKELLEQLNNIVHPIVYNDFDCWAFKQKSSYVIKESALLLNGNGKKDLDKIILVDAYKDQRKKRVQKRDPFRSVEEINAIIKKQEFITKENEFVDFVISNNDGEMLLPQLVKIKQELELTSFT